jgi:hypothetical protein
MHHAETSSLERVNIVVLTLELAHQERIAMAKSCIDIGLFYLVITGRPKQYGVECRPA